VTVTPRQLRGVREPLRYARARYLCGFSQQYVYRVSVDTLRGKSHKESRAHAANDWPHAIAYGLAVQSVLRELGARTLRIHHLIEATCPIGLDLHTMQVLVSSESRNFAARVAGGDAPGRIPAPAPSARTRTGGRALEAAPVGKLPSNGWQISDWLDGLLITL
jgi:hypothetical protein